MQANYLCLVFVHGVERFWLSSISRWAALFICAYTYVGHSGISKTLFMVSAYCWLLHFAVPAKRRPRHHRAFAFIARHHRCAVIIYPTHPTYLFLSTLPTELSACALLLPYAEPFFVWRWRTVTCPITVCSGGGRAGDDRRHGGRRHLNNAANMPRSARYSTGGCARGTTAACSWLGLA